MQAGGNSEHFQHSVIGGLRLDSGFVGLTMNFIEGSVRMGLGGARGRRSARILRARPR
jgi:hypothetical protein